MVVFRWALLSLILITTASLSVGSTTVVIAAGPSSLSSRVAAQADQDLLALVIQDIDTFWSLAFAAADEPYDSPALVPSDGPVWTSCDRADPFADGPLYCGLDQTIYYSPSWFTSIEQQAGDFAWILSLIHI